MRTANIALSPLATPSLRPPLPVMAAAFCLLWASAFSVAKLAIADCPPLIVLTARFLLAGVVILGAAALCGVQLRLSRRELLLFALLGIANQAVYLGLSYVGIRSTSSGLASLVISANPVVTAVLAVAFLNERMTWRKAMGLVLGVGGVAYVVESRMAGGIDRPVGIAFLLVALVSLVAGTILCIRSSPQRPGSGSAMACKALWPGLPHCRSLSRSKMSVTSCRAGGSLRRSPIWRCSSRSSPICSGSTCSTCRARPRRAPITS